MERRKALAVAATGAMLSASGAVAAMAGLLSGGDVAVGGGVPSTTVATATADSASAPVAVDPVWVTETRDVYDTVVVRTAASGGAGASTPSGTSTTTAPPAERPVPTTTSTTSTVVSTTTTTRPPGVPRDWPADKPIPPMPVGCEQPQLEDNGVWNCQH